MAANSDARREPRSEQPPPVSEQRRTLWNALNTFITSQGGWVVSPPFGRFVRIEVKQGSSLPVTLEEAGTVCVMPE